MLLANLTAMRHSHWGYCLLATLALTTLAAACPDRPDAAARRRILLNVETWVPEMAAHLAWAMGDEDPVVARTAARLMVRCGSAALPALTEALNHEDLLVRRTVAIGLAQMGPEAIEPLAVALKDEHYLVRHAAVLSLVRIGHGSKRCFQLLSEAGQDEHPAVREAALDAARGLFVTVQAIRLPKDGWKFKLDPDRIGRDEKWFAVDVDDAAWDDIGIEKPWQDFGYNYTGAAWYRRTISLPPRPDADRIELAFEGVDECAWVWINGQYAGEHNIGPEGWDDLFRFDVTDLLRWGEDNQITVIAMNTAFAGGIWRPVTIMALKLRQ